MSSVLTEETVHPPFSNSCWAMFWAPARAVLFRTMSGSELASAGAAGVTCAGVVRGRALDGRADRGADAGTLAVTGPVSLLACRPPGRCSAMSATAATPSPTMVKTTPTARSMRHRPGERGARCDTGVRLMGADMDQTSIPSRRADRCRCRPARRRRSRLTSSGSTASAAGASMSVFSTW